MCPFEQDNFIISKFDNFEYDDIYDRCWRIVYDSPYNYHNYHTSWNDLMRVVGKISDFDNQADEETCRYAEYKSLEIHTLRVYAPIGIIYKAVIDFVNWYLKN